MTQPDLAYCETCKRDTKRCQYYPAGRSRQHGKCLECDRNDIRNSGSYKVKDSRYCIDCDRAHQLSALYQS